MGNGKWRATDMVSPSWGNFQKPNQTNLMEAEEQELSQEIPGMVEDQEKPESEKPNWGEFQSPMTYQGEPDPTADEGVFDWILRGATRTASRVAEQVGGRYGNLEKFAKDTLVNTPKMGGVIGWAISELVGPERWERLVRGTEGKETILPTSQDLKKALETISAGYTSPKTKNEGRVDEFVEDVGATLLGRRVNQPRTPRQMATNHVLIPAAANFAKQAVKELGFGEDKANMTKMAVWLPLSLYSNVNGSQYASNLMNQGRNGFNPNLTVNVPTYQNQLNTVQRNMLQGDPRSALAQQQIAGIHNDLANGQTSMRDLMTRYDAINAAKRDRGLFQLNIGDRRAALRNINEVRDVVRDQITNLGQSNPQALRDWQNGVQAWATIHRSNAISNWIQDVSKGPYAKILTGPAAALFGIGSYGAMAKPLIAGPAALASAGSYKTGQVLYRMWNDPRLGEYYWNAVNGAMAENAPVFIRNYNKLNKELEKPPKKEKK